MRKLLSILLIIMIIGSLLTGCAEKQEADLPAVDASASLPSALEPEVEPDKAADMIHLTQIMDDGRARPSSCGRLQVLNGKLCSETGYPVMLRGVSTNGLITAESYLNEALFSELSGDIGVNLFRLAMYTYGVGIVGYCTNGDKDRHKEDIVRGVDLAREHDMYALIDWHVLSDGDPNEHVDEAVNFFSEMAERFSSYNNVLYEICNEPNGVDWETVKEYAGKVIPAIREKDPKSVIIVGNPDWSKDLYNVAADPLEFDNIMYTFHFYSATHGQEYRDMVAQVSAESLPVFVTEFGVTSSSGGFPRDLESADLWIDLLEKENISYCMWSFSSAPEACSAVRSGVIKYSGFEKEDYTATGQWLLNTLAKHNTM